MSQYNNIVSDYFFENFKGGKGGRLGRKYKDDRDKTRDNITTVGIFFAISAFLYLINRIYPS